MKMCLKRNMFFLEGFVLMRARAGPMRAQMAHMGPHGLEKLKEKRRTKNVYWGP